MSLVTARFWRVLDDGVAVAVKVTPRARRVGVGGVAADADVPRLLIAVHEAPEDGKANRAACLALAKTLDVAPGRVTVMAGAASRRKTLLVAGDVNMLTARLAAL